MDSMRSQLITLLMYKSSSNEVTVYTLLYSFFALYAIDKLMVVLPQLTVYFSKYFEKKMITLTPTIKEKQSSITFDIYLKQTNDILAHSLLDFITSRPNIQSILYSKQNFMLNHKNPILIDEHNEIYICLLKEDIGEEDMSQTIEIYSYMMNVEDLRAFIRKIEYNYTIKIQNKLGDRLYYFNDISTGKINKSEYNKMPPHVSFTMKPFVTNRQFKNVIGAESKLIERRVNFFKQNQKWYNEKGIPYTLGLLLSGPPGGGKTSTIKCVANEMRRHIINIKLHKYVTKTQMENLFFNDTINVVQNGKTEQFVIPIYNRIYVFEDIDCNDNDIVLERKEFDTYEKPEGFTSLEPVQHKNCFDEKEKEREELFSNEKLSLSCLLNILDGILEAPGRIIIMTTNFPKLLDKALIRPGRIDLICEFTNCTNNMVIEFIEKFYDILLDTEEINDINQLVEYKYSPAEITKVMFENFDSYINCIEHLKMLK
jgi:DNA replication protein DnaC